MNTPLLIYPMADFEDYIHLLSESARKNYRACAKRNKDLTYELIPFDKDKCHQFMQLWSQQLVRGKHPEWAFPVEHIANLADQGIVLLFQARRGDRPIALHFVEKHEDYVECHPPMYDKRYNERNLGTWMWFMLQKYNCEHGLGHLDLGGGNRGTWRDIIIHRDEHEKPRYKFRFVPQWVKDNPKSQPNYVVIHEHGRKYLTTV